MRRLLLLSSLLLCGCGATASSAEPGRLTRAVFGTPRSERVASPASSASATSTPRAEDPVVPVAPVEAPTLTLQATYSIDLGEPLEIEAVTNCDSVEWYVIDRGLYKFPEKKLIDTKSTVVWGNTSGSYRLLAYTSNSLGSTAPQVTTVVVGQPLPPLPPLPTPPLPTPVDPTPKPPDPAPTPTPVPTPTPTPVPADTRVSAKNAFVVTIDDWSKRIPGGPTSWLADTTVLAGLRSSVREVAIADIKGPEATLYAKQLTAAGGTPIVLIMDSTTKPWTILNKTEMRLPTSGAAMSALLGKYVK